MATSKQEFGSRSSEQMERKAAGAEQGRNEAALKPCSPAVCIGGAQPTSCYCPTTHT